MNKEELIIDLIAHPERYSDSQMQQILSDDECLAAYTAMLEARMAIDKNTADNIDTDAAWQNFATQHSALLSSHRNGGLPSADTSTRNGGLPSADIPTRNGGLPSAAPKWRHIAAIFIGAIALSGIAFAAIHTLTSNRPTQPTVQADIRPTQQSAATASTDTTRTSTKQDAPAEKKPVFQKTFENVNLADMLHEIAAYYGMTVEFRNPSARSLRYYYEWNSATDASSVIDELNQSEQVAITIEGKKIIVE